MTKTIKLTAKEKKELKIQELRGGYVQERNKHKVIDKDISTNLMTLTLKEIFSKKKELKAVVKNINRFKRQLKSYGVNFDENGNIEG